jgi:hypothetical protein
MPNANPEAAAVEAAYGAHLQALFNPKSREIATGSPVIQGS